MIISYTFMYIVVSWERMASWGDLPAKAPHMLVRTWMKTAGAMQPKMSFRVSLTSLVAHTMGRQFTGTPSPPSCRGVNPGWPTRGEFPTGRLPGGA